MAAELSIVAGAGEGDIDEERVVGQGDDAGSGAEVDVARTHDREVRDVGLRRGEQLADDRHIVEFLDHRSLR